MDEIDLANEIEQARVYRSLVAIKKEISEINEDIYCIDCDEEIDEERRQILPSAKRCLRCQQQWEKMHRVKKF